MLSGRGVDISRLNDNMLMNMVEEILRTTFASIFYQMYVKGSEVYWGTKRKQSLLSFTREPGFYDFIKKQKKDESRKS